MTRMTVNMLAYVSWIAAQLLSWVLINTVTDLFGQFGRHPARRRDHP